MIGIITVVTNEKYNLDNFYISLINQSIPDFKLYLTDNNSTDGSLNYFKELNSAGKINTEYISLNYNSGFSGGSNTGAKKAIEDGCDYLFIVNNDVELDKNCLEELYKLLTGDSNIAAAGPLLLRHKIEMPGLIQEFGGKINFKSGEIQKFYSGSNVADTPLPEKIEADFIGGGVLFIRSDVFSSAGYFDDSYFAYFDEIDLSYRLKKMNNYSMFVTSKAIAYHNHKWNKKNNFGYYFEYYLSERNKFLFFRKYRMYGSMLRALFMDLFKFPWRLRWFKKKCDFKLGFYYLKGLFHGLLNIKGKPKLKFVK